MKHSLKTLIGAFAAIGIVSTVAMLATPARGQEKEDDEKPSVKSAPVAKISPVKAMMIAEAKSGGKAGLATFELDEGQWVYGVIVAKNHKLMEVEINPVSGKVVETENVTPEGEAKEYMHQLTQLIK